MWESFVISYKILINRWRKRGDESEKLQKKSNKQKENEEKKKEQRQSNDWNEFL